MNARSFIVATWVLQAIVCFAHDDAQAVLIHSVEAEQENLRKAEAWVYDELITYTNVFHSGKRKKTGSVEFEVIALEGRPYYKLVRRNGKELKKKELQEEETRLERVSQERRQGSSHSERQRFSIPFSQLADEHVAQWRGNLLVTSPRVPGLRHVSDLITTEQELDPRTLLRKRAVVKFLEASGINPEKTEIVVEYITMGDGTSLIHRILYRRPYRNGWHETEQVYSNYHKFEAESVIRPVAQLP